MSFNRSLSHGVGIAMATHNCGPVRRIDRQAHLPTLRRTTTSLAHSLDCTTGAHHGTVGRNLPDSSLRRAGSQSHHWHFQLDCDQPNWRGFIQIRLLQGATAFRYALPLDQGETLKRSHVIRQAISPDNALTTRVTVLEDVLDQTLQQPVQAGDVLLEDHFAAAASQSQGVKQAREVGAWIAREIIPRGNRLRAESFEWGIIEGRSPSDLVHAEAEFAMLESLRDILPGDKLRRSAVKMAPAVRKNEEVQVTITRGALTVTNIVRISRDATIGEAVQVENVESGRQLRARVTGIGQVEIM